MITKDDLLNEVSQKELNELCHLEEFSEERVLEDAIKDAKTHISTFVIIPEKPNQALKNICIKLTLLKLKEKQDYPRDKLMLIQEELEKILLKMSAGKTPIAENDTTPPRIHKRFFIHNNWSKK